MPVQNGAIPEKYAERMAVRVLAQVGSGKRNFPERRCEGCATGILAMYPGMNMNTSRAVCLLAKLHRLILVFHNVAVKQGTQGTQLIT